MYLQFAGEVFAVFVICFAAFWYVILLRRRPSNQGDEAKPNHVAALLYGAQLLSDDITYFNDWSAAMLREFDGIDTYLRAYYRMSDQLRHNERLYWPAEAAALVESNLIAFDERSL